MILVLIIDLVFAVMIAYAACCVAGTLDRLEEKEEERKNE